jgi:hypothetical protein
VKITKLLKIGFILVILAVILTACGGATSTSAPAANPTAIPTFTPAATAPPGSGQAVGVPGVGQVMGAQPISGTVESYDAAGKALIVKTSEGKSQKFGTVNATVLKSEKVPVADLSKYLDANTSLLVMGEKGSDGSYNAQGLQLLSGNIGMSAPVGNAPANLTLPPNFTPPGGGNPPANFTPLAGANFMAGGTAPLIIRSASVSGTKLTGTSITGENVMVNLSDSTNITRQANAKLEDLKAGLTVSVLAPPAQDGVAPEAFTVVIS